MKSSYRALSLFTIAGVLFMLTSCKQASAPVQSGVEYYRNLQFSETPYDLEKGTHKLTPEEAKIDELTKRLKSDEFLVYYPPTFPSFAVLIPGVINKKRHYATAAILMTIGILLSLAYSVVLK